MKRLIPLFAGLSLVSCDSGTKHTEGTSSETQTALQALADNVRDIPSPRAASMPQEIVAIASRGLGGFACPQYDQSERYWTDRSIGLAWDVDRSKTRTCGADSAVVEVFGMYRKLEDSSVWTRTGSIVVFPAGNLVRRTVFETSFGGGFRLRHGEVERLDASFGPDGDDPYRLVELTLSDDRIETNLLSGEFVTKAGVPKGSADPEVHAFRSPVLDLTNRRAVIGHFYQTKDGVEVRDLQGVLVAPHLGAAKVFPDSMGARLLSLNQDGDSVVASLRLQLADPSEFAPAASALVLLDSVAASSWNQGLPSDSIPFDVPRLELGAASHAQARRIEWKLPSPQDGARIGLLRRYPAVGGFGPWRLAALVRLDGKVVAP